MTKKIRIHGKEEVHECAEAIVSAAKASDLHVQKKEIETKYDNEAHIRISDKPIKDKSPVVGPDFILFINEEMELKKSTKDAKDNTMAILNAQKKPKIKNIKKKNIVIVDAYNLGLENISQNIVWPAILGAFINKYGKISLTNTDDVIDNDLMKIVHESHRAM